MTNERQDVRNSETPNFAVKLAVLLSDNEYRLTGQQWRAGCLAARVSPLQQTSRVFCRSSQTHAINWWLFMAAPPLVRAQSASRMKTRIHDSFPQNRGLHTLTRHTRVPRTYTHTVTHWPCNTAVHRTLTPQLIDPMNPIPSSAWPHAPASVPGRYPIQLLCGSSSKLVFYAQSTGAVISGRILCGAARVTKTMSVAQPLLGPNNWSKSRCPTEPWSYSWSLPGSFEGPASSPSSSWSCAYLAARLSNSSPSSWFRLDFGVWRGDQRYYVTQQWGLSAVTGYCGLSAVTRHTTAVWTFCCE